MNHIYKIKDVWMSLIFSTRTFAISSFVFFVFTFIVLTINEVPNERLFSVIKSIFYFNIVLMGVHYFKNSSYTINMKNGEITIPRSDVENSLLGIITFSPYWNLLRNKTIDVNDVEGLYLDTNRNGESQAIGNFNIVMVGKFGSAKLEFYDRQKRDEVRNAITQAIKKFKHEDISFQVAEL